MWTNVAALAPAIFVFVFFSGTSAFRIVTIAVATALLTESAARWIFKKKSTLYDGSAVLSALIFSLLCPASLPSWLVALGSAFMILFGKEIFGGLGQNPFNPALVGIAFILAGFPAAGSFFFKVPSSTETGIFVTAIFLGGIWLVFKKMIEWELPVLYAAGFYFLAGIRQKEEAVILLPFTLLAAFFLVTDPVTTPLTRPARRAFAAAAGVLGIFFYEWQSHAAGAAHGILIMNALAPRMDLWFRPKRK